MALSNTVVVLIAAAMGICGQCALAADADGCAHFKWDVSHELTVIKQAPQALAAATKPDSKVPLLKLDKLYELKFSPQAAVMYSAKPAKLTLNDSAQGGLVRFHVDRDAYTVSRSAAVTGSMWLMMATISSIRKISKGPATASGLTRSSSSIWLPARTSYCSSAARRILRCSWRSLW